MARIGLLDCNNFFVSCERLFRPDLVNKPVAVLSSNDGCIVARSQEVKDMGIPMGLPLFQAKQLCDTSSITFFSSNFTLYRDVSARVMKVLEEAVGKCDVYSIDEAFFAIPEDTSLDDIRSLRSHIIQNVGIPVSIGVAETKTLAKEASKIAKKQEGVFVLDEEEWRKRAPKTQCNSIWGLGRATSAKLSSMGVDTVDRLLDLDQSFIRKEFGIGVERICMELAGNVVHKLGKHIHDEQKSIMCSRSFAETTNKLEDIESAVAYHIAQACEKLRKRKLSCSYISLHVRAGKYSDFNLRTSGIEIVLDVPTNDTYLLTKIALQKVREVYDKEVPYKKAGVVMSGLVPENNIPLSLFGDVNEVSKNVDKLVDALNNKFGSQTLRSAVIQGSKDRSSSKLRSKNYTTSWGDIPNVYAK